MSPPAIEFKLPSQSRWFKRWLHKPIFNHYMRLFSLVVLINGLILFNAISHWQWWSDPLSTHNILANTALANFFIAILIRQPYLTNTLYWLVTAVPTSWPLSIRRTLGKIYHLGGIHSACAFMGTLWFLGLMGSLIHTAVTAPDLMSISMMATTAALLCLLTFIMIMSLPPIRSQFHNLFEQVHRWGGGCALLLFWVQILLINNPLSSNQTMISSVLNTPALWMLIMMTLSISLPWLRLKKVNIEVNRLSRRVALVTFDHGVTPFVGSSFAISRTPLKDWHAFNNITTPKSSGFRLLISKAGDWTGEFIENPPPQIWIKGIPTAGVAYLEGLFKRVVYVTTGAGIGTVLPHLSRRKIPTSLVWAANSPRDTYGDALVNEVITAQPNACIWDTNLYGQPDLIKLAVAAYQHSGAEAIICISNQDLTTELVYALESRGIPIYGAIKDY